jgi:hypothetical protein
MGVKPQRYMLAIDTLETGTTTTHSFCFTEGSAVPFVEERTVTTVKPQECGNVMQGSDAGIGSVVSLRLKGSR